MATDQQLCMGDMAVRIRKVLARPQFRPQGPLFFWSAPRTLPVHSDRLFYRFFQYFERHGLSSSGYYGNRLYGKRRYNLKQEGMQLDTIRHEQNS